MFLGCFYVVLCLCYVILQYFGYSFCYIYVCGYQYVVVFLCCTTYFWYVVGFGLLFCVSYCFSGF